VASGSERGGHEMIPLTPTLSPAFAPQGGASRRQAQGERGTSGYFVGDFLEEGGLDKRRSGNYFSFRKSKKGVMSYGMGINNLETIWGADPF